MKDTKREKKPTSKLELSKQQQYDLEQALLDALRALKQELSDYHDGEDNIPKDIKMQLDKAFEAAFTRFQTTARSVDLSRDLEGQLPDSLWNVPDDHVIFSGNKNGPFDVILERREEGETLSLSGKHKNPKPKRATGDVAQAESKEMPALADPEEAQASKREEEQ